MTFASNPCFSMTSVIKGHHVFKSVSQGGQGGVNQMPYHSFTEIEGAYNGVGAYWQ